MKDAYLADSNVVKQYTACLAGQDSRKWMLDKDGFFYRMDAGSSARLVVPDELIDPLITAIHIQLRHQGPTRVLATMQSRY